MVRLLGNNLSNRKKVYIALTAVYGVGIPTSYKILSSVNVDPEKKVADLTETEISAIRDALESNEYQLEGDLKRFVSLNIKRLSEINCVRGQRHRKMLPLRGQRTRTNARARRGAKKTVASKKK